MILALKRFVKCKDKKKWVKNQDAVKFDRLINLTNLHPHTPCIHYELVAVGHHTGDLEGGHCFATTYNKQTNNWFQYNDEVVTKI